MYRREPHKCSHHWNRTSEKRLRTLKLPTLRFRRLRGDMIETFKIWKWIYDRKVTEDLFELNQESKSRSQHLRSKNKEVVWMSENVSLQTELWTYGTTLRKKSLVLKNLNTFKNIGPTNRWNTTLNQNMNSYPEMSQAKLKTKKSRIYWYSSASVLKINRYQQVNRYEEYFEIN